MTNRITVSLLVLTRQSVINFSYLILCYYFVTWNEVAISNDTNYNGEFWAKTLYISVLVCMFHYRDSLHHSKGGGPDLTVRHYSSL